MSVTIEKDSTMRDGINRAVDTGTLSNRQLTEWRKVLFAILEEFDAMPDGYIVIIQGDVSKADGIHFANQLRIPWT